MGLVVEVDENKPTRNGFLTLGKCTHPDRPRRARGMCGSCYEQARRNNRLPGENSKKPFVWDLIDELEFHTFTWPELERSFGRNRAGIANSLRAVNRKDLIDTVDYKTFGGKPSRGRKKTSK